MEVFLIFWFGNCFGYFSKHWANFFQSSVHPTNCVTTAVKNENTFVKLDFGADAIKKLMVVFYKLF
jgi:hypothetical protein